MIIRNTMHCFGLPAILVHWIMALLIIGLFVLGLYMTSLTYYDPWYNRAPWWHKSLGLSTFALLLARALWAWVNIKPAPLGTHHTWEIYLASFTHWLLYILLFGISISGYLIATAKGQGIDFFGWFELPPIVTGIDQLEDKAGAVHLYLAYIMAAFVTLHTLGALKHHFIDKDKTLERMWFSSTKGGVSNET